MLKIVIYLTIYALSLLHAKPLTNYPPTTPEGCEYEGQVYSPGESFNQGSDSNGRCYGLYCIFDGNVIPYDNFNCGTSTTTPLPSTTQPFPKTNQPSTKTSSHRTALPTTSQKSTIPQPPGCEHEGKFYLPGSFNEGTGGEGLCFGLYCSEDGSVTTWDDWSCGGTALPTTSPYPPKTVPKTTSPSMQTTPNEPETTSSYPQTKTPATSKETEEVAPHTAVTQPPGCEYEGKFYAPGEEISKGSDGKGRCYSLHCSEDGNLVPWENFNCSATMPPTTTQKSTTPTTTTPMTATSQITTPRITITPPPLRCEYEGELYAPGEEISKGSDGEGRCYGLTCSYDGNLVPWENFNCGAIMPPTTTQKSTTPSTTTPTTTTSQTTTSRITITTPPLGCEYEGKLYAPGEEISKGSDGEGRCYSLHCSEDGNLVPWETFNCDTTTPTPEQNTFPTSKTPPHSTMSPTTTPKTTTEQTTTPKSTPPVTAPQPLGCEYEGKFYLPGSFNEGSDGEGWCFGLYCSEDGSVTAWDDWSCGGTALPTMSPTTLPTTFPSTSPSTQTTPNEPETATPYHSTKPPVTPKETFQSSTTPQATTPFTTIPPHTAVTQTPGCEYEGKIYAPGEEISKGSDGKGRCYSLHCSEDGNLVPWENFNCGATMPPTATQKSTTPKTTTPKTTTSQTTTPRITITPPPLRCEYEGELYAPGEEISKGSDGEGRCYGLTCSYDGNLVPWENLNCGVTMSHTTTQKSTTPATTTPQTIISQTTTQRITIIPPLLGCEYEGKSYAPGEEISNGSDGEGWCYGLTCSYDGNVVPWDNYNCATITPPIPTTTPHPPITTLDTPTTPIGCMHEDKFYPPGEISQGTDGKNWCYGLICDPDGQLIAWDNWDCGTNTPELPTEPRFPPTTISTTSKPPTTLPRTTKPTTTPSPSTTTFKTRSTPTTNPSLQTNPNKQATTSQTKLLASPSNSTPQPIVHCFHEGKYYENGEIISRFFHGFRWCSGWYCNEGKTESWSDFNCAHPTTFPTGTKRFQKSTTTTPSAGLQCYYKGIIYNDGDVMGSFEGSGGCDSFYCADGVLVPYNCAGSGIQTNPSTTEATLPTAKPHQPTTKTNPPTKEYKSPTKKAKLPTTKTHLSTTARILVERTDPPTTHAKQPTKSTNPPTTKFNLPTIKSSLSTTGINLPTTKTSKPPHSTLQSTATTKPADTKLCFHEGKYYEEGDIISRDFDGSNWCSGWLCKGGRLIPLDCGGITGVISKENPSSPKPQTVFPPPTLGPGPSRCFYEGRYYEEGDLASKDFDGDDWCSGFLCKGGEMVLWDCDSDETTPETTLSSPVIQTSDTTKSPGDNLPTTVTSKPPHSIPPQPTTRSSTSHPTTQSTASTKSPDLVLCFHKGKYYEEGDIISRDFDGSNWCSGWLCKSGQLIPLDCGGITGAMSTEKPSSPKHQTVFPPTTLGPEPARCFHDGRYYEEGDLASKDFDSDDWCSGLLCKGGEMVLWDCDREGTTPVTTPSSRVIQTSGTTQEPDVNLPTTETIKPPHSIPPQPTIRSSTSHPTTHSTATTKSPDLMLCFHEGKYYEEGDIISRDFDGSNWCSGWLCKGGRLIPLDCGGITGAISTEEPSSPKPQTVVPTTTLGPEPSRCFHEGRYYEEGDIASNDFDGNDWCSGLLCKGGEMVFWDCGSEGITPEATLSSPVIQTSDTTRGPKSTAKFSERTTKVPESTSKVPKDTTKISGIVTPDITKATQYTITKPLVITARSPDSTTGPPDTTTKITETITRIPDITAGILDSTTNDPDITTKVPDTTTRSPDTTTRTPETTRLTIETTRKPPDTTTKHQDTTPTQPPETTKPEKLRCYYKGLLYPPGEVTRGVLSDGRCYGVICDISGVIIQWVSATCTPTEPPTAEIKATLPGCVYHDKYYPPGRISRISDGTNWCLDVICTEEGKITSLNKWDCNQATTSATPTTATTASPTLRPEGNTCLYNGMRYPPGIIKEGIAKNGWCYKVFCQVDGQLYLWGDWNCKLTFKPSTRPPETTTPPVSKPCSYNGKDYPVGIVTRGEDATGWCFGVTCREDGQILLWGSFQCGIQLH